MIYLVNDYAVIIDINFHLIIQKLCKDAFDKKIIIYGYDVGITMTI